MRTPVKLNQSFWPHFCSNLLPSAADPRRLLLPDIDEKIFTDSVSVFKFGTTFKSTQKARFPLSIKYLSSIHFTNPPVIIDVGASDGSTSFDVIQAIRCSQYFVTDLNTEVYYNTSKNSTWFYNELGECILYVNNQWIVYPDTLRAIFPFNIISRRLFLCAPIFRSTFPKITLINPIIQKYNKQNVSILKYDIFDPWPLEKADLIITANILNLGYFSANHISQALKNIASALKNSGRLVVIDNRPSENASVFLFSGNKVVIEQRINNGTEIEHIVLDTFSSLAPPRGTD